MLLLNLRTPQSLQLDAVPGIGEAQTEVYLEYREGVLQPMTQQCAKSASGAASFAGRQARALQRLGNVCR